MLRRSMSIRNNSIAAPKNYSHSTDPFTKKGALVRRAKRRLLVRTECARLPTFLLNSASRKRLTFGLSHPFGWEKPV